MTTQNPNLPPPTLPGLLPPPSGAFAPPVAPQDRAPLVEPLRAAGSVLPPPSTLPVVEEVRDDEVVISPFLQRLEKNANPEFLLGLSEEIDTLEEEYEALAMENQQKVTPIEFIESVNTKIQALLNQFELAVGEKAKKSLPDVAKKAEIIDKIHYSDQDPDESGQRIEAIKPVLVAKFKELLEEIMPEGIEFARGIIDRFTATYTNVEGYEEKLQEISEQFMAQLAQKRKSGADAELVGADDALAGIIAQSLRYKPIKFIGSIEKRKVENAEATQEAKNILTLITERIKKDKALLSQKKSKELSKWLQERLPDSIETDKTTTELEGLAERLVNEVKRRFEEEAFQDKVRKTYIAPVLVEKGLIERKRSVPQPTKESAPVVSANLAATWVPEIIKVIPKEDIESTSTHIGRYLAAGGSPMLLEAAYKAAEGASPDLKSNIIKGLLFIPEQN